MLDTKLIGQEFYPEGNARTPRAGLETRAEMASGQGPDRDYFAGSSLPVLGCLCLEKEAVPGLVQAPATQEFFQNVQTVAAFSGGNFHNFQNVL